MLDRLCLEALGQATLAKQNATQQKHVQLKPWQHEVISSNFVVRPLGFHS